MPTSARAVRTVFTEICGEFNGSLRADVHPQGVGRIRSAPSSLTAALAIGPYKYLQWNADILHHRRMRRWPVVSAAACFTIFLRGNCFRWERCLHAGGAVVQIYRKIFVCWPQCSSMGSSCGTAAQSDPHPASLFAYFF